MPEHKTYDDLFYGAWQQVFSLEHMLPLLLKPKFEEQGIHITDEQLAGIVEQAKRGDNEIDLGLEEDQLIEARFSPDEDGNYQVTIDLTDELDRLDEFEDQLPTTITEMLPEFIEESAEELKEAIDGTKPDMLKSEQENREFVRSIIDGIWGAALDDLHVFVSLVTAAGKDFAGEYQEDDDEELDYKYQVLIRLHARACQIGKEIHTLLREGFADGAHARWRSLHEVVMTAKIVFDSDQEAAERYLLHRMIEAKKAAHQHKKYAEQLDEPPPTEEDLAYLDTQYALLKEQFGEAYTGQYGWAAALFNSETPRYPRFSHIEERAGFDYLRPYYRLASHNIHANPTGILFRLGEDPANPSAPAGPSIFGLADPGEGTALSLLWITTWLLTYCPTIDRSVRLAVLMRMTDQIIERFYRAHWKLLDEEE